MIKNFLAGLQVEAIKIKLAADIQYSSILETHAQ